MTTLDAPPRATRTGSRALVVLAATVTAVFVNLLVYAVGRIVGGDFTFTSSDGVVQVDAATVAGFSAVPLGLGLTLVALLVRRLPWIARVALVVAPLLAMATILVMTIPVDLDPVSTVALATCHVVLVPISIVAIQRLRH